MSRRIWMAGVLAAALSMSATPVRAQHGHTMLIGSDADGSGQLDLHWDFAGKPIARTSDSGFPGLFTGDVPGFNKAADDPPHTYALEDGTEVHVEVTAIEENVSLVVSSVLLDSVGDSALVNVMPHMHNHPEFRIQAPDENTFAEGSVSFRVFESGSSFGYTPSEIRQLHLSNGYLPPLETATEATLTCQKTVAAAIRAFANTKHALLSKCLDLVYRHAFLAKPAAPAVNACHPDVNKKGSLARKLAAARALALAKIGKKCDPSKVLTPSSTPYTLSHVSTHLGMASCRVEELIGATYNHAVDQIGHVLEHAMLGNEATVLAAFPCMKASIE